MTPFKYHDLKPEGSKNLHRMKNGLERGLNAVAWWLPEGEPSARRELSGCGTRLFVNGKHGRMSKKHLKLDEETPKESRKKGGTLITRRRLLVIEVARLEKWLAAQNHYAGEGIQKVKK